METSPPALQDALHGNSGKRQQSRSIPRPSLENVEELAQNCAEEPIPYLATISMNQVGFLRARKCTRDEFVGVSRVACSRGDNQHEKSCADSIASPTSQESRPSASNILESLPVDRAAQSPESADDISYLEQILEEVMEAAKRLANRVRASTSAATLQDAETLPSCAYLLRTYFRIDTGAFKPQQQDVCFSILAGVNTLAVCPTGWGKSLCYQFPMLVHRLLFECRYARCCRQATTTKAQQQQPLERAGEDDPLDNSTFAVSLSPTRLPADLFSRFCVVVSPLLALMEDQAEKINGISHLNAFVLSSKVDAAREERLYAELESPLCQLDFLFASPEKFISSVPLRRLLQSQAHRLALVCVDEVHCVSGWAYDFRPAFMYVSRVLQSPVLADPAAFMHQSPRAEEEKASLAVVPYLCLTATATRDVVRDVQASFNVEWTVMCGDHQRENLQLQVTDLVQRHASFHRLPTSPEGDAEVHEPSPRVIQDALLEAVQQLPKPMIVYVQTRADADALSGFLSSKCSHPNPASSAASEELPGLFHPAHYPASAERCERSSHTDEGSAIEEVNVRGVAAQSDSAVGGLVVRCYHAALTRSMRSATQKHFIEGKIDILVATIAFGMGIDKANIRSVIHASAPSSLEGYVQEIGRAGRDGAPSICRVLYNPFDFYVHRCRLWSTLLSPSEMQSVVSAIFSCPSTRVGPRLMLVSVSALSTELGFSTETIETVLFLLLTATGVRASRMNESPCHTESTSLSTPFKSVLGSYPLSYRVLSVQEGTDRTADSTVSSVSHSNSIFDGGKSLKRRRTSSSSRNQGSSAGAGVALLLRQLGATDAVLELCRVTPNMSNVIEMANTLSMPLAEFQQRMQELIDSGTVAVTRYGTSSALLLELSESFPESASPASQRVLVSHILSLHRGRLDAQVDGLRRMFGVLQNPSHKAIAAELDRSTGPNDTIPAHENASWNPPGRTMSRLKAVSVVNAFVEENRLRIHSTYEALRALLGIRPKSLIQHGKYAGQLPLAQSWYVKSPYFGALCTFELTWVLKALAPHQLDIPSSSVSG